MVMMSALCRCAKRELMRIGRFGEQAAKRLRSISLSARAGDGPYPPRCGVRRPKGCGLKRCTPRSGIKKKRFPFAPRSDRKPPCAVRKLLGHFVLDDSELATIVTAGGAYGVIDVESTAVGALGERGSYGLVMSATLEGAGLGLSSFRMCHGEILFLFVCFRKECRWVQFTSCQPVSAARRGGRAATHRERRVTRREPILRRRNPPRRRSGRACLRRIRRDDARAEWGDSGVCFPSNPMPRRNGPARRE